MSEDNRSVSVEDLRQRLDEAASALEASQMDASASGLWRDVPSLLRQARAELGRLHAEVEAGPKRLNDILEMLPAYLVLLSPDRRVLFANRFFREHFGEPHGRRCFECLFERNEPCETCESFKPLETGTSHRWEWTGPDGRNYDVYDFPFADTDGSTVIMEMGIDVTERKRAEEALRQANAYNRSLIEASPDPLVTIGPDGKITDVNAATEAATGRSRAQLIGTDFSDYFTEPEKARAGYQQAFRDGSVRDYPLEICHRDGRATPVLYNASVYRDEEGKVIGVFAAARDITQRKRAEAALKEANETLERRVQERTAELSKAVAQLEAARAAAENERRRLEAVMEALPVGVAITNVHGGAIQANSAYEKIWGHPRPTAQSVRDYSAYQAWWADSGQPVAPHEWASAQVVQRGEPVIGQLFKIRRFDGSIAFVINGAAPVRDASGEIVGSAVAIQDITELRQAEQALAREAALNAAVADLARALISSASMDEIANLVLEHAKRLTHSKFGFVGYIDPQSGALVSPTLSQDIWSACRVQDKDFVFHDFRGLWGWVMSHHQPLLTNDPASDPRSSGVPAGHIPIQRFLSAPAMAGDTLLGQVALANSERDYTEQDLLVVERMASLYALTIRRQQAEMALRRYADEQATLYATASAIAAAPDPVESFAQVVDVLIPLLGADASWVVLIGDDDADLLRVVAWRGVSDAFVAAVATVPPKACAACAPLLADERGGETNRVADCPHPECPLRAHTDLQSYVSVPLTVSGRGLGVLVIAWRTPCPCSERERALLFAVGHQIAVALENSRLRQQTARLAVLEERQRLARELHDSVTQSLYSLTLFAEAGREWAEAGDLPRAHHNLTRIADMAQQALKEMRLLVYRLRPLSLERGGFVEALRHRLNAVEERAGVEARLLLQQPVELSGFVEEAFYAIAQEALNNALKHARASAVTVHLRHAEGQIELEIVDNGVGFALDAVQDKGGLGLSTMRERAESVGGTLTILSAPGEGTRVIARVKAGFTTGS